VTRRFLVGLLAASVAAACSGAADSTGTGEEPPEVGAADAGEAAAGVLRAVIAGDPGSAVDLTALDQMPIVALLEGMPAREALVLDDAARRAVAANFWAGFGDRLDLPDDPSLVTVGRVRGIPGTGEFSEVVLAGAGTEAGTLVSRREGDRYLVDVLASFGPVLAGNLAQVVESLEADPGAEAGRMLDQIREQRPSLMALRSRSGVSAEVRQIVGSVLARLDG
jgi:hypothetical protein